jgi:hypothetical protein
VVGQRDGCGLGCGDLGIRQQVPVGVDGGLDRLVPDLDGRPPYYGMQHATCRRFVVCSTGYFAAARHTTSCPGSARFPALSRQYGKAGVGLLPVPALDFDDGWLHSRMALLRGVENGMPMARVGSQGSCRCGAGHESIRP